LGFKPKSVECVGVGALCATPRERVLNRDCQWGRGNMCVVELLLVGVGRCDPNYVRLIEAVSYSSTYVSLVYGADSINGNIYRALSFPSIIPMHLFSGRRKY
jgi:hypothetical protein